VLSLTRLGALVPDRRVQLVDGSARLALAVIARVTLGLGAAATMRAGLGVGPYDVFLTSLVETSGLDIAIAAWCMTGALSLVAWAFGRRPTLASLAFPAVVGPSIGIGLGLLPATTGVAALLLFTTGLTTLVLSIGLILATGTPGGPLELLMQAAEDRGLSPARTRTALELALLLVGVLLGGEVGAGTAAVALMIGPGVHVAERLWDRLLSPVRAGLVRALG
jgi:uncharacterized membrane protein YczE